MANVQVRMFSFPNEAQWSYAPASNVHGLVSEAFMQAFQISVSRGDLPSARFEDIPWPKPWLMHVLVSAMGASHLLLYANVSKRLVIAQLHCVSIALIRPVSLPCYCQDNS